MILTKFECLECPKSRNEADWESTELKTSTLPAEPEEPSLTLRNRHVKVSVLDVDCSHPVSFPDALRKVFHRCHLESLFLYIYEFRPLKLMTGMNPRPVS